MCYSTPILSLPMPTTTLADYTQKLLDKTPFKTKDVHGLLQAFHANFTGTSVDEYGNHLTQKGITTYELLAQTVNPNGHPTTILDLDLACGDGPLAEIIFKKYGDLAKVKLLDMSEAELAAAQKRLAGYPNAEYTIGTANKLPYNSNSVDYVLCHMALMLLRPITTVFKEIGRVLKPLGTFSAIIPQADGISDEKFDACCKIMGEITQEYLPHFNSIQLGIKHVITKKGLARLAKASGCFAAPEFEDVAVLIKDTPQKHFELFSTFYYPPFFPPKAKAKFKEKLLGYLESIKSEDGTVAMLDCLRKVTFIKTKQ
jgi:ubiquinone/menaquinone biosynthesis C-methylase UbiE